ncbi:MAG: PilZ domain-containing protein [Magnetococcus sp. YQC-5]
MGTWNKLTQAVSKLKGAAKTSKPPAPVGSVTQETGEENDNVLTNEARIVEMLMQAVDSNAEVLIAFGSKVISYKTHFQKEKETGASAGTEPSSEYLREMAYVLIGPTDPLDGTTKLLHNQPATLSFVSGGKFNEFEARYLDEMELQKLSPTVGSRQQAGLLQRPGLPPLTQRFGMPFVHPRHGTRASAPTKAAPGAPLTFETKQGAEPGASLKAAQPETTAPPAEEEKGPQTAFRITFPDKIFRKPQRRNTVRARYSDEARVALRITREAGVVFFATIVDVSTGGLCFRLPEEEAPISEGSVVEGTFQYWLDEEEVLVTERGTLLKMGTRQGKTVGQIVFANDSYEVIREIGELVAYVERVRLQARSGGGVTGAGGRHKTASKRRAA